MWGLFYTKFSKKLLPPTPFVTHPQLCIWAPNQKSTLSILFASSNPFQNGMTPYNSIKNHGAARFQAKGLGAGQSLHRRDWAGVLLTQKLLDTNLATPESFIPIDPTVQKLIDIFQNTESH